MQFSRGEMSLGDLLKFYLKNDYESKVVSFVLLMTVLLIVVIKALLLDKGKLS